MRELAVQSASDSISNTERGYLDTEFSDLSDEINRVAAVVEYNGIGLLDGSAGTAIFQVGTRNSADDRIMVDLQTQTATALGINAEDIATQVAAQSAIDLIDSAMGLLNTDRATLGSTINTLNSAVDHLASTIENYGNSLSQILSLIHI